MKNKSATDMSHTFAICAYQTSPYLEACILSIKAQKRPCGLLIATSTPNEAIEKMAEKYDIPVIVNPVQKGIGYDFDFALQAGIQSGADLVTVAHQDDCYDSEFSVRVADAWKPDTLIAFTDYREIDENGVTKPENKNLKIKKILLFPMRFRALQSVRPVRRTSLAFGNGICCPSVTFAAKKMPKKLFAGKMKSNVDWSAWEILSRKKGSFTYIPKALMSHRIHDEATTNKMIYDHKRSAEDLAMFRRFWPTCIAKCLCKFYSKAEETVTKR
ncbi:MAG: glycosyltransferase family 2 protein [Lachnospiraceae bacterium]|nr:glycosyltransferase family 2 protein [Lachnospiraceae bacterium]